MKLELVTLVAPFAISLVSAYPDRLRCNRDVQGQRIMNQNTQLDTNIEVSFVVNGEDVPCGGTFKEGDEIKIRENLNKNQGVILDISGAEFLTPNDDCVTRLVDYGGQSFDFEDTELTNFEDEITAYGAQAPRKTTVRYSETCRLTLATNSPTSDPTAAPVLSPTGAPTVTPAPTASPIVPVPTTDPTTSPTKEPTPLPTNAPTTNPTASPVTSAPTTDRVVDVEYDDILDAPEDAYAEVYKGDVVQIERDPDLTVPLYVFYDREDADTCDYPEGIQLEFEDGIAFFVVADEPDTGDNIYLVPNIPGEECKGVEETLFLRIVEAEEPEEPSPFSDPINVLAIVVVAVLIIGAVLMLLTNGLNFKKAMFA